MGQSKNYTFISFFRLPKRGTTKANLQEIIPVVLPFSKSQNGSMIKA